MDGVLVDVKVSLLPNLWLRIVRYPDGMFAVARQEIYGLVGAALRLDRWIDGRGGQVNVTAWVGFDPRLELALRRLTATQGG